MENRLRKSWFKREEGREQGRKVGKAGKVSAGGEELVKGGGD